MVAACCSECRKLQNQGAGGPKSTCFESMPGSRRRLQVRTRTSRTVTNPFYTCTSSPSFLTAPPSSASAPPACLMIEAPSGRHPGAPPSTRRPGRVWAAPIPRRALLRRAHGRRPSPPPPPAMHAAHAAPGCRCAAMAVLAAVARALDSSSVLHLFASAGGSWRFRLFLCCLAPAELAGAQASRFPWPGAVACARLPCAATPCAALLQGYGKPCHAEPTIS